MVGPDAGRIVAVVVDLFPGHVAVMVCEGDVGGPHKAGANPWDTVAACHLFSTRPKPAAVCLLHLLPEAAHGERVVERSGQTTRGLAYDFPV